MIKPRPIELLAPARNLECAIAAVDHGADAVYIGASRFSARSAAGNSIEDIEKIVNYAHIFNVRVYVALNTILKDEELLPTQELIWQLYNIGVDALIVQDMGILKLNLPPIPLHASTQMDNRSVQKAIFLKNVGFRQIVLARELSLLEINKIHDAVPDVPLEVFVHGALCVSYSGQCYVSQACFNRSANRGECAQFCRLSFNLVDSDNKIIVKDKHLLSLKDMNQSDNLEKIIDAGASSLKIEGRLKDAAYVKNVTAYYRKQLDKIIKRRPDLKRASSGKEKLAFTPQLDKSFSRGFTSYFLFDRNKDIFSFDTPKSLGEEMGYVKEIRGNYFTVAGVKPFSNGDGLCYIDSSGKLQGFRVNKVEENRLYPQQMPSFAPKTLLYRNYDQEFEKTMQHKSAERRIEVDIKIREVDFGFSVEMRDDDGNIAIITDEREKQEAHTSQTDNIRNQLAKLGNTPFLAKRVEVDFNGNWFIPSSELSDLRRRVVEQMLVVRRIRYPRELAVVNNSNVAYPESELTYLGNVMNSNAASFYKDHGVRKISPAFEKKPVRNAVVMFCKHCIRYSLGWCPVHQKKRPSYREPFFLVSTDGRRFRLEFDCKKCQMKVHAEK